MIDNECIKELEFNIINLHFKIVSKPDAIK